MVDDGVGGVGVEGVGGVGGEGYEYVRERDDPRTMFGLKGSMVEVSESDYDRVSK